MLLRKTHLLLTFAFFFVAGASIANDDGGCDFVGGGSGVITSNEKLPLICDGKWIKESYTFEVEFKGALAGGASAGIKVCVAECDIKEGTIRLFDDGETVPYQVLNATTGCYPDEEFGASRKPKIRIEITDANKTNSMSVALYMSAGTAPTTTTLIPTTVTTTRPPYDGPLSSDPKALQIDLAVAIDVSGGNPNEYYLMQQFAAELASRLTVHTDIDNVEGARLSLIPLTPSRSLAGILPWVYDNETFGGFVTSYPQFPQNDSIYYFKELEDFLLSGFDLTSTDSNVYGPRKSAQRVLLLLTSKDSAADTPVKTLLDDRGVLSVLAYFNDKQKTHPNLDALFGKPISEFAYKREESCAKNVDTFLDEIILHGDNLCQQDVPKGVDLKDTDVHTIQSRNFEPLKLGEERTGEKGLYCNLQNTKFELVNSRVDHPMIRVRVQYDLEPEKDYLRIRDASGTVQAFFTGFGLTGSEICIKSSKITVEFVTNEKQVYRGFKLDARASMNCDEPWP